MNQENEQRYREEFEELFMIRYARPTQKHNLGDKGRELAYLAGRKKGEEEQVRLSDVIQDYYIKWKAHDSLVREQIKEIAQLKAELESYKGSCGMHTINEIKQLKEELKRERECVDFYANKEHWQPPADQGFSHKYNLFNEEDLHDMIDNDDDGTCGGKRAREVQAQRKAEI